MPTDDGSKVRIVQQVVFRGPNGNWWHIALVCNRTSQFRVVEVTSHPYVNGRKMMNRELSKKLPIPPGSCIPFVFQLTGKPTQYYTDAYEWEEDDFIKVVNKNNALRVPGVLSRPGFRCPGQRWHPKNRKNPQKTG